MASDKEFFVAAFETILRNLNPAQLSTISESLAEACVKASQESITHDMGSEAAGRVTNQQAEAEPSPPAKAVSRGHKRRESTAGGKRVVNGFICFRCKCFPQDPCFFHIELICVLAFYCSLFEGLAQRFKSGLLRQMWSMESRRNIFGLLGRAFSDLRDNHAESVPMEGFLAVASEAVPLVPASEYLIKMGWEAEPVVELNGDMELRRDVGFNVDIVNAEYPPQTRLSVADIVEHCYARGFLSRGTRRRLTGTDVNRRPQGGHVNMAVAAAPPSQCFSLQVVQQPNTVSTKQPKQNPAYQ